jgi:hypothetical protein
MIPGLLSIGSLPGRFLALHDNGEGMRRAPVAIAAAIRTWIPVVMAKAPAVPWEFRAM